MNPNKKIFFQDIELSVLLKKIEEINQKMITSVEERVQEAVKSELNALVSVIDRKIGTRDAAKILKCDPQTVRAHVERGLLTNLNKEGHLKFWLSEVIELRQNWTKYSRNF